MYDQNESPFVDGNTYFLLNENDSDWLERSLEELYVITDLEDLKAGLIFELERWSYILGDENSFRLEYLPHGSYEVVVNYRERLNRNEQGQKIFLLLLAKKGKEMK